MIVAPRIFLVPEEAGAAGERESLYRLHEPEAPGRGSKLLVPDRLAQFPASTSAKRV